MPLLDFIFIPVAVFYSYIWNHTLEISFLNPLSYCRVEQRSLPLQVIFVVCSHHILTLLTSPCPWFPVFYVNEGFFLTSWLIISFKSHFLLTHTLESSLLIQMSLACYRVPVRYKTILLHNTVYNYSWFSSLLFLCVFELISSLLVVNREVVRQEAERGRGDPVRDRPKAEASDGFGGCQRTAEASRLDHWVECGLWVLHRLQWLCCLNWRSSNEVSHFHKAGWADGSKKKKKEWWNWRNIAWDVFTFTP